jgi:alkylhydroperoxidase family enzyme
MEVNSAVGRADGISQAHLAALGAYAGNPAFTEPEQAALAYAEDLATGNRISGEVFEDVRRHFSEDQIVELTAVVAWEICAAKFNRALEIEGQGICLLDGGAHPP